MTLIVLRHEGREYQLNSLRQALRAEGTYKYFTWNFFSRSKDVSIRGRIQASPTSLVGLTYKNPPGGSKTCLNSKIASCVIEIAVDGGPIRRLHTANRAAFEILTDRDDHGISIMV